MNISVIDFPWPGNRREDLPDLLHIGLLEQAQTCLEAHRLDFYEIIFLSGGEGMLYLDNICHYLMPCQVIFTSPGQVRCWQLNKALQGYVLAFPAELMRRFFSHAGFAYKFHYFHNSQHPTSMLPGQQEFLYLEMLLLEMRGELRQAGKDSPALLKAMLYQLLIKLQRSYSSVYQLASDTEAHLLYQHYRMLIEQHFREKHLVQDYAAMLHITAAYLSDVARKCTGLTANDLLKNRLLLEAKRMIRYSGLSIAEIARELNFQDPSYFNRFFKKLSGYTPLDFRRQQ